MVASFWRFNFFYKWRQGPHISIMNRSDFNYDLPKELIAQVPLEERDSSRLMVIDRRRRFISHKIFREIIDYVEPGDCLVLNNTKVVPVRLFGRRKTGAKVEIFILNPGEKKIQALVRPSKRVKEGEIVELENGMRVKVGGVCEQGRIVEFEESLKAVLAGGHMPLPPYISREDKPLDKETYQTVFALKEGATAAPTAGLHFTEELLAQIRSKGVEIAYVTLHTNYGTFAPVKVDKLEEHVMHFEEFEINSECVKKINKAKADNKKIISVGTTSTRVLESVALDSGRVKEERCKTNLFIYPGYKFKIVDKLITNFHLPESTLLMLVSAFGGREFMLEAYEEAVRGKYRFFSYGDAMLIE